MNPPSASETEVTGDYQVTLNVSILQAVESSDKDICYKESVRDGERKRIYESPTPSHHFHIEYKLLPGKNSQVFKTDVVTFGNVVAKVYTDRDNRVVQCWSEDEGDLKKNHYGWKHKHTFKVNKAQLLELYDHVLEVRVWNTKSKLSARAKYDRPKAFRIPIRNTKAEANADGDVPGIIKRPSKFAVVYHDQVRRMKTNRRASRLVSTLQVQTMMPTVSTIHADESGGSIEQMSPRRSFNTEGMIQEVQGEGIASDCSKEGVPSEGSKDVTKTASSESSTQLVANASNQLVPVSSSVAQASSIESAATQGSNRQLQVISRRKQKRLEAEAAEEARIEREGIVVLKLNLLDLFGKHGFTRKKLTSPAKDLKHFEVSVSVADFLLTEQLSKELNPMMITVLKATDLPSSPVAHEKLQQRCDPVFVKYQFHSQSSHCTPGAPQSHEAVWNDTHVTLLGTIDHQLLVEYLRGPPLVLELHDRAAKQEDKTVPALFGDETRDDVLGTHVFTTGLSHSNPSLAIQGEKPWSPYGVARLDLSGLLTGQRMLELTVPVTNGPRCPSELYNTANTEALPPGDYIGSQCQIKVLVEVSHPLCLSPERNTTILCREAVCTPDQRSSKPTPERTSRSIKSTPQHTPMGRRTSKLTPEHTPIGRRSSKMAPELSPAGKRASRSAIEHSKLLDGHTSKLTPEHVKSLAKATPDTCPFNRAVYIISADGHSLVNRLITTVNKVNAKALNLEDLPEDVLPAALSTYKLTKDQMTSSDCDVITGFHVQDREQHVIVLEGLKKGGLRNIWGELPHHHTEDEAVQKVLYNSEFEFSSRLYATLDVDLPMIRLYQPLSELTQQSLVYIRDSIPDKCFRILMTLNELRYANEISDVTRNNLFPKPEEVTALSLQFALPASASINKNGGEDATIDTDSTCPPASPAKSKTWAPLDLTNPDYERHLNARRSEPVADFITANKLQVLTLSETSASKKLRHPTRQRSLSETTQVHNYSSQTFNSIRLAKANLRERLSSDPNHRYTYCQHYHSMTVVPTDIEAEKQAQKQNEQRRWQTSDGFMYPGVPSARSSNVHPRKPHSSRIESLYEPFEDNKLHANTLKPTVERMHFGWENRSEDFEHWRRPPNTFGPPLPVTIHLAGETRAKELQETLDREHQEWTDKLVVSNPQFHPHRRGVRTELTESGPKAGTQLDKLCGLLKDSPQKHSLKQAGLTVHDIPALDVVHNPRLANPLSAIDEAEVCKRGYVPGPNGARSLKLNSNVIPLTEATCDSHCRGATKHKQDFRLYYHIPTIPAGAVSGVVHD